MFETGVERFPFSNRGNDVLLAVFVVSIIILLVMPLAPVVLDILISLSIILAVTTLLVTLYADEALSFSSFPSLLLFITLFRLGLNIASTRMILTEAQAGEIIKTFGLVVTGGNQLVGLVLFTLLTTINFIVITKGAGRVAEVAARFTLDAMPGKQMAIDADLNVGVIDEEQAQLRRQRIIAESDFYGAMDGASKFVRGDAIAGIIITLVNVIGGFIVGMVGREMSLHEVIDVYMTLAVGDGLVTQIPALLISVGAGIIVTRSSSKQDLGALLRKQLLNNPRVLFTTATILLILGLMPGMPLLVIMPMAIAVYLYSSALKKTAESDAVEFSSSATIQGKEALVQRSEKLEKVLFVDPLELELGYDLSPLATESQEEGLFNTISKIRRQIADELGIVIPIIRVYDNKALPPETYRIKVKGNQVATGVLYRDKDFAIDQGNALQAIEGVPAQDPVSGWSAFWISPAQRKNAEARGYLVSDPLLVLAAHLSEVIRDYAHELLNRQEVSGLLQRAKPYASAVINELIPHRLNLGQLLKVLQSLLREYISIRDIVSILEILADHSSTTTDTELLTEFVRQGMARSICRQYVERNNVLYAVTLDPKVEQMFQESIQVNEFGKQIVMHPTTYESVRNYFYEFLRAGAVKKVHPIVITTASIRAPFKKLVEREFPHLPVLSFYEIVSDIQIVSIGVVPSDVLMLTSPLEEEEIASKK